MSLSKKHYIAIADIIKGSRTKQHLTRNMAGYFGGDNPQFSMDRFYDAVYPERKRRK